MLESWKTERRFVPPDPARPHPPKTMFGTGASHRLLRVRTVASAGLAIAAFLGAIAVTSPAFGRDAWVIRVVGIGAPRSDGNPQLWTDEAWVHNSGTVTESMRLVDASNGVEFPMSDPLPIGPGRTIFPGQQNVWFLEVPMSVFHLDIGDDVIVASRLVSQANVPVFIDPAPPFPAFGAVALPVFYEIPPAGSEQLLFDVDLPGFPARINLALFNAASAEAHALVEVMSACDDRIVETEVFTIPPDFIGQYSLGSPASCSPSSPGFDGPSYLRVTIDQPGFAVAATLANHGDSSVSFGISSPAR